jgi:hypothetical protein
MRTQPSAVSVIVAEIRGLCKKVGVDNEIRPGPKAKYPDSLIITILILKSLFGFDSEISFLRFLGSHHKRVFPELPEQSWFNRKAKKLTKAQDKIHKLLCEKLETDGREIIIVDTTPVPVVKLHRAGQCKSFKKKTEVSYGYCASKKTHYYGKKLSLFVTEQGIPTAHGLTPANRHDLAAFKKLLPSKGKVVQRKKLVADKGYYDGDLRYTLEKKYDTRLVVPDKKRYHK